MAHLNPTIDGCTSASVIQIKTQAGENTNNRIDIKPDNIEAARKVNMYLRIFALCSCGLYHIAIRKSAFVWSARMF